MADSERQKRVGSAHCRLTASGPRNSGDCFRAMSSESGLTQPDPLRTIKVKQPRIRSSKYNSRLMADATKEASVGAAPERRKPRAALFVRARALSLKGATEASLKPCLLVPGRFIPERLDKIVDEPTHFERYALCARINRLNRQISRAISRQ